MAKLSARGRKELVRLKKSEVSNNAWHKGDTVHSFIVIMDDGVVLRKVILLSWEF